MQFVWSFLAVAIGAIVIGCCGNMAATTAPGGTQLEQARARIRTLTDAFRVYAGDHDDVAPPGNRWMDAMAAYVPDGTNFLAPGVGNAGAGIYGFAMSEAVGGQSINSFSDTSAVPLFFDSTVTARNAVSNLGTLPVPGRHDGKNAISYLDGFQEGYDVVEESQKRLKQLATATLIYSSDYDDHFPTVGWMDALAPYAKQSRIFRSPMFDGTADQHGYALNADLAGQSLFVVDDPSTTFLLFDSTNLMRSAIAPVSSMPQPGRYNGYNTMAHADGSTRFSF